MSALLNTILDRIKTEFEQVEPEWVNIEVKDTDLKFLHDECTKDSEFDPHNKRRYMYESLTSGNMYVVVAKCEYGQVFCAFETMDQMGQMPWGLWARILRMFSEEDRKPFKVFFLANRSLREFPPGKEPITPENINGGYTYRCDPETILIYRAEDATRVLIHELQHSCCLDKPENGIDIIEAETEAWAELFYMAILSQGRKYMFNDLIKRQSEWMRKQNAKVKKHMKNPNSMEFPWRYTIGKEEVWKRWGILSHEDLKPEIIMPNSLRLTYPVTEILKDRFKVSRDSTIL
jgi:hypothetical protein